MFGQTIDILKVSLFLSFPSAHFLFPRSSIPWFVHDSKSKCWFFVHRSSLFPQIERNGEKEREKAREYGKKRESTGKREEREERKEPNRRGLDIDQKAEKSEVVNSGILYACYTLLSLTHRTSLHLSLSLSLSFALYTHQDLSLALTPFFLRRK